MLAGTTVWDGPREPKLSTQTIYQVTCVALCLEIDSSPRVLKVEHD